MIRTLVLFLLFLSPLSFAKKLSVAIYDYPPAFIVNNGDRPGYCYEIIQHLYSNLGYEVTKLEVNFPRAMRSVENQEIDLLCAVNTFNSKNLTLSKQAMAKIVFYFWAHKDSQFFYDGVKSLKGQRILNISGFNYSSTSQEYQNYLEQPNKIIFLSGDKPLSRAFNMIARGRADIIALDRDNAYYNIKKFNLENEIKIAGRLPNYLPAYVGVSNEHPHKTQLLQHFDTEYPKLIKSGFVHEIMQKYNVFTSDSATQLSFEEPSPKP